MCWTTCVPTHSYDVVEDHEVFLLGVVDGEEVEEVEGEHTVQAQEQHVHPHVQVQHEGVWGVG